MIHLVTFATDDMSRASQLCAETSKAQGVGTHARYSPRNMSPIEAVKEHPWICDPSLRGCGFWAWKAAIIDKELSWLPDGSILIYSDAGVEFIDNVKYIIDRMDQDIFLFGNMWEHAHWCKRDIVEMVWPRWGKVSGVPWGNFGKQVQASVIFFRVSDYTRKFVKEWLDWCLFEGGRLIDDSPSRSPNHPEFRENRHDQAILTTMAYRDGIKLHWWPAMYNDGAFIYERGEYPDEGYPVLFHHHRRRNHEWSVAA